MQPRVCRTPEDLGPGAFCVYCGRMPRGREGINLLWVPVCDQCCKKLKWPCRKQKDLHTPKPLMQFNEPPAKSFLDLIGEKTTYLPLNRNNTAAWSWMGRLVSTGCLQPAVRARYGQALGVPQRYWSALLSDFLPNPNMPGYFSLPQQVVNNLLNTTSGWTSLLAIGGSGVGKTHLAAAWLYAQAPYFVCASLSAGWIRMGNFLSRLRRTYDTEKPSGEKESDLLQTIVETDFLVIDELAVDQLSSHGMSVVLTILEGRSNRPCGTFITTNNTLDAFQETSPRIASRLGSYRTLEAQGLDRRQSDSVRSRPLPQTPPEPAPQFQADEDDCEFALQDAQEGYHTILEIERMYNLRATMQRTALLKLMQMSSIPVEQVVPQGDTLEA